MQAPALRSTTLIMSCCVRLCFCVQTNCPLVSSPVRLVLLLPNVGTRLHAATSPSLVVRQTRASRCSHTSVHTPHIVPARFESDKLDLFTKTICCVCLAEPVRPIDPAAWISHTTALTGPYPHYGKGNASHHFSGIYNNFTTFKE